MYSWVLQCLVLNSNLTWNFITLYLDLKLIVITLKCFLHYKVKLGAVVCGHHIKSSEVVHLAKVVVMATVVNMATKSCLIMFYHMWTASGTLNK